MQFNFMPQKSKGIRREARLDVNCQMACRLEQAFLTFSKKSRKKLKAQTPKVLFHKTSDIFLGKAKPLKRQT